MTNGSVSSGTPRTPRQDFEVYDRLPEPVRRSLQDAAFNVCSEWVDFFIRYSRGGEKCWVKRLEAAERSEILKFALKSGRPSLHLEARVSIQRYGALR